MDGRDPLAATILRVNHAGECAAIAIYRAQIAVGRLLNRPYVALLDEFLVHEKRHFATFDRLLKLRGIPRCRTIHLCAAGGYVLGFVTAILGHQAIMTCTRAVESVVNRHLDQQLEYLQARDHAAYDAVASIVADERHHHDVARDQIGPPSIRMSAVDFATHYSTEAVIWLGMRL